MNIEKVEEFRIALNLCQISCTSYGAHLILCIKETMDKKGDSYSVKDAVADKLRAEKDWASYQAMQEIKNKKVTAKPTQP